MVSRTTTRVLLVLAPSLSLVLFFSIIWDSLVQPDNLVFWRRDAQSSHRNTSSGVPQKAGQNPPTRPIQLGLKTQHAGAAAGHTLHIIEVPAPGNANASLRAQFDRNRAELEGSLAAKGFATTEGHSGQVLKKNAQKKHTPALRKNPAKNPASVYKTA
jgi:hypothetical protein